MWIYHTKYKVNINNKTYSIPIANAIQQITSELSGGVEGVVAVPEREGGWTVGISAGEGLSGMTYPLREAKLTTLGGNNLSWLKTNDR